MDALLARAQTEQPALESLLEEFVKCESPSDNAAAVTRFMELVADRSAGLATAKTFPSGSFGRNLLLTFNLPGPRRKQGGRILAVGHGDTVWPVGTLAGPMPWRKEGGRLHGPGVLDMKGGVAFFLTAMRLLRELDIPVTRPVALWLVSDEEVGSLASRPLTEKLAAESEAVLVPEPGTGLEGKLKTARKGVGDYVVTVRGKAAHAGVDFSSGASAIVELARQIERIAAFTNLKTGLTVNPGLLRGGTRTNVVAAEALVEVDVRVARLRDHKALDKKFHALKPVDRRCTVEVTGGLNRPPMERTPGVARLFRSAREIGRKYLDLNIEESSTGGGSDGNFTAGMGIPTLDGLGAVGEGAHAPHESILVDRMADRVALLAHLVRHLGQ
jgi:glutamate carboxypeptidase